MGVKLKSMILNSTPGVGTYDTHTASRPSTPEFSFQQAKRPSLESKTLTPGPCSYTVLIDVTKKRSANVIIPKFLGRSNLGLGGHSVKKNGLQAQLTKSQVVLPGPGAYDIPVAFNV